MRRDAATRALDRRAKGTRLHASNMRSRSGPLSSANVDAPAPGSLLAAVQPDLPAGWEHDQLTCFASLAGLPALSLPASRGPDGLPRGVQVVGRAFDEATVLRVAHALAPLV